MRAYVVVGHTEASAHFLLSCEIGCGRAHSFLLESSVEPLMYLIFLRIAGFDAFAHYTDFDSPYR